MIFGEEMPILWADLVCFLGRDSAEASAETSVDLTEASVSAESLFTPIRSFTNQERGPKGPDF